MDAVNVIDNLPAEVADVAFSLLKACVGLF